MIETNFDYSVIKQFITENESISVKIKTGKLEIPLVLDSKNLTPSQKEQLDDDLTIKLYVHGRAGNYSEINYDDNNPNNQILPTK